MSVGSLAAYVGLLLRRSATVSACYVLLLLCLGLHLGFVFLRPAFSASLEGNASQDNGIDIVSSELIHNRGALVVEQSYAGEGHCDAVLIACLDNIIISDRATRLSDILNTASVSSLYIIAEWEECIRSE